MRAVYAKCEHARNADRQCDSENTSNISHMRQFEFGYILNGTAPKQQEIHYRRMKRMHGYVNAVRMENVSVRDACRGYANDDDTQYTAVYPLLTTHICFRCMPILSILEFHHPVHTRQFPKNRYRAFF